MNRIAVVVKGYPRLSETFIAQEILGLEKLGLDQLIVSLRHPTDPAVHDMHEEIGADVLYLPEYLKDDPARVRVGRRYAERLSTYDQARTIFERDLARDKSVNRWRRWGQACVFARELPEDIRHIHVHYLHTPCSVTRYAALLRGLTWSFSAHAKDIWTTPEWEIREKIADCEWGVTCTAKNTDYLKSLADDPGKIELVYHGLDFDRFPQATHRPMKNGAEPVRILSVGRAVEKKGFADLLRALARLPDDIDWRFDHIGGGPLRPKLQLLAKNLGVGDRVTWHGAQSRDAVIEANREADLFALPCVIAKSGDRDGVPNVLVEAQALGVPVVSTSTTSIPELIKHGETGLLVEPGDRRALTRSIEQLARDPNLRRKMGTAGARRAREKFAFQPGLDRLAEKFGLR